jgi:SRSO17 transposase
VFLLDSRSRKSSGAITAGNVGGYLGDGAFRKYTWRHGTREKLSSRFCFRRVKVAHDDGTEIAEREPIWLVMEWPDGESAPTKFVLTTLPRRMSKKQIVRTMMERWRTERAYQEMKGELGLDHFEGRSFRGWHHHITVVLCCYAFIVGERVRHFSPSEGCLGTARPHARAA